jgi:hypothetical protein
MHDVAPSDEDLIALALDDEALPEKAADHLATCETCKKRLARYQQTTASLVSQFYRSQCPSGTELSYYCAGGLPDAERLRVASHILDCPLCRMEVEETRQYLQAPIEFPVPAFSPRALVRRIYATLVKQPQLQFVLRSDAIDAPWPRQYKAESVDISLHVSRTSSGEHMLIGILTSTNPDEDVETLAGVAVELYPMPQLLESNGEFSKMLPLLRTQVDDLGNLVFKPVPTGVYTMILRLPGREVVVEGLAISET